MALPFIMLYPGYALLCCLFPAKRPLSSSERLALAFGLSLVISPGVSLLMWYAGMGLPSDLQLFFLVTFDMVATTIAMLRRVSSRSPFLPFSIPGAMRSLGPAMDQADRRERAMTLVLAAAVLSTVLVLAAILVYPPSGERFTEIYILDGDGNVPDQALEVLAGTPAVLRLGIVNHEQRTVNYTIEIWMVLSTYYDDQPNYSMEYNEIYFVGRDHLVLESQPTNSIDDWSPAPEPEKAYGFNAPKKAAGDDQDEYQYVNQGWSLWFVVIRDDAQSFMNNELDEDPGLTKDLVSQGSVQQDFDRKVNDGWAHGALSVFVNLVVDDGTS